jgi:hypothetical protein
MRAHKLIELSPRMVRSYLTAPPRACRVAAYRVSRVTSTACGSGLAEAGWERDKRNRGRLRIQRDGLCLVG